MAQITRSTVWSDGQTLSAAALNGEFNNALNSLNIVNADISGSAAIAISKIATGLSGSLVGTSDTQTLTNKKITKRVTSATNYTTDTGTSLNCDTTDIFIVTAQAGALKFNNPSGTPVDGQTLWLAVTGTGARALTYGTQFESSAGATLPTTTVTTARIDIGLIWRADTSKWHCVAVA